MKNLQFILFLGVSLFSFNAVNAATYDALGTTTTYVQGTDGSYIYEGSAESYKTYTTVDGIDGNKHSVDSAMASKDLSSSGQESEQAFLDAVVGGSYSWEKTNLDDNWKATIVAEGVYGLDVSEFGYLNFEGGYFMLKFGGGTDEDSHWIFENIPELNTLTWLASIQGNESRGRLSHFSLCMSEDCLAEETPIGNPVPVPAAVWLFGSALLGLTGFGRKKVA